MPDPAGAPEPPVSEERGESLLSQISTEMVRAMKKYYGKGPTKAKSYLMDDLLFVVMRGGTTRAEETLVAAGREDTVRDFRQQFQNEMDQRLTGTIEQLTGRKVINYQSQILLDPDMSIEIFVFDSPIAKEAREETAQALMEPEERVGEVAGDEVPADED